MKHTATILPTLLALLASCLSLRAAPIAGDAIVYALPETTARVTGTLAAGTVLGPVTSPHVVALPSGWQAVERVDTLDCWVRDNDLDKELNIKVGAQLYAAPNAASAVVGAMAAGDLSDLSDIQGRWAQMRYKKRTVGYIQIGEGAAGAAGATVTSATATSVPATVTATAALAAAKAQAPAQGAAATAVVTTATTATAAVATTTSKSAAAGAGGDEAAVAKARSFEGTFMTVRRSLIGSRPYEYQLNDANGERLAYLDLSTMAPGQRVATFDGMKIVVFGTMQPVAGSKDIVIRVETMRAK